MNLAYLTPETVPASFRPSGESIATLCAPLVSAEPFATGLLPVAIFETPPGGKLPQLAKVISEKQIINDRMMVVRRNYAKTSMTFCTASASLSTSSLVL